MGKKLKRKDVSDSDSDSLADEIAPKIKKVPKQKKAKKHKSKHEKKKSSKYLDSDDEISHKKRKRKKKKHKRSDASEDESDHMPVKRKKDSTVSSDDSPRTSIANNGHSIEDTNENDGNSNTAHSPIHEADEDLHPSTPPHENSNGNESKVDEDDALLSLEEQKALIQAQLMESGDAGEISESDAVADNGAVVVSSDGGDPDVEIIDDDDD